MIHATGPEKQLAIEFRDPQKRVMLERLTNDTSDRTAALVVRGCLCHTHYAGSSRPASLAAARLIAPLL
jgi:hypothetical protein